MEHAAFIEHLQVLSFKIFSEHLSLPQDVVIKKKRVFSHILPYNVGKTMINHPPVITIFI